MSTEVFIFRGNLKEKVPRTAGKLKVNPGTQILRRWFCAGKDRLRQVSLPHGLVRIEQRAFAWCLVLQGIKIPSTVDFIGELAFSECDRLAKLEFQESSSPPSQKTTIAEHAFAKCVSLQRIRLPSPVAFVHEHAFFTCRALIEANLSKSCVSRISESAFSGCRSLQTISLPRTLEVIDTRAFGGCYMLVTVVVPLDSQSQIFIGEYAFLSCKILANFWLPKYSSAAHDESFCGLDKSRTLAGLNARFDFLPIHMMCYDSSTITSERLLECCREVEVSEDAFRMTPFHILCSTTEPRLDLLQVLLDEYPHHILDSKDATGKRPLDYLIHNLSDATANWLETFLQKRLVASLLDWGALLWAEEMKSEIRVVLFQQHDKRRRVELFDGLYSSLRQYEKKRVHIHIGACLVEREAKVWMEWFQATGS